MMMAIVLTARCHCPINRAYHLKFCDTCSRTSVQQWHSHTTSARVDVPEHIWEIGHLKIQRDLFIVTIFLCRFKLSHVGMIMTAK
jgi:hypothetical protein